MKSFKQEYTRMIQEDMPELWERIEAGLKDSGSRMEIDMPVLKEKKVSVMRWRRYAVMATAGVCVLLMIPAALSVLSIKNSGSGNSNSASQAEAGETDKIFEMGIAAQATQSDEATAGAASGETKTVYPPNGTVIENIEGMVVEVKDMQYHTVYRMIVEQDESGWLAEGEELEILSETEEELEEGMRCRMSVVYNVGTDFPFRLIEWEKNTME